MTRRAAAPCSRRPATPATGATLRPAKPGGTVLPRLPLVLAIALLCSAPAAALTLTEALEAAAARTAVRNAELVLADAEQALARTTADPLALRPDLLQADQAAELAAAQVRLSRFEAEAEIARAFTGALEAERGVALAEAGRDLLAQALRITRIRYGNGSATELDVLEAEAALQEGEDGLSAARQGRALARRNLESLLPEPAGELAPIESAALPAALPPLLELEAGLELHPQLLQVTHAVELARMGVRLLDPSYAPRAQIDTAELQLRQAEAGAREARRGLSLQVRSLHAAALRAADALATARATLATTRSREEIEQRRLEAGLIAEIAYRQARVSTLQAEAAAEQALHEYLLALLDLQVASATEILER